MAAFSRRVERLASMHQGSQDYTAYILSIVSDPTLGIYLNLVAACVGFTIYVALRYAVRTKKLEVIERMVDAFSLYEFITTWIIYVIMYVVLVLVFTRNAQENMGSALSRTLSRAAIGFTSTTEIARSIIGLVSWYLPGFNITADRRFVRDMLRLGMAQTAVLVLLSSQLKAGADGTELGWRLGALAGVACLLKGPWSPRLWTHNRFATLELRIEALCGQEYLHDLRLRAERRIMA